MMIYAHTYTLLYFCISTYIRIVISTIKQLNKPQLISKLEADAARAL